MRWCFVYQKGRTESSGTSARQPGERSQLSLAPLRNVIGSCGVLYGWHPRDRLVRPGKVAESSG
jgi:hypothetical protein